MTTIEDVHKVYEKTLHIESHHLIDVPLAVFVAKELENRISLIGKGASGSGKSAFTEPLRCLSYYPMEEIGDEHNNANLKYRVFFVSRLTPATFAGGTTKEKEKDLGYWLEDHPSMLIYSDLAPLLTMGEETRMELFGLMRDMYDGFIKYDTGRFSKHYKNIQVNSMAFATQLVDLESEMYNLMGTREICYKLPQIQDIMKAFEKRDSKENREMRNNIVKDFLDDIGKVENGSWVYGSEFPKIDKTSYLVILNHVSKATKWRASAITDDNGFLLQHVEPELPMRLAKQFFGLYKGLRAIGLDNASTIGYVLDIVNSCGVSIRREIMERLYKLEPEVSDVVEKHIVKEDDEGNPLEETIREEKISQYCEYKPIPKAVQEIANTLNISPMEIQKQCFILRDLKMLEPIPEPKVNDKGEPLPEPQSFFSVKTKWKPTIKREDL